VFLLNATSLAKPNAVQLLHTELVQLDCDCALITETWYTKKHQDTLVGIPNDTLFRRDRLRGKGGGVCAYVRSSISCSVFVPGVGAQSRVNDVEILWLDCILCMIVTILWPAVIILPNQSSL